VAPETHVTVRDGAARAAPTAPHATPRTSERGKPSGPERFWSLRYWQAVFVVALGVSLLAHYAVIPWRFLPSHAFEFHDVDGTLTIPIDILNEGPAEPPPPPPPDKTAEPPSTAKVEPPNPDAPGAKHKDAGPDARKDASEADASESDAGTDATSDAEANPLDDASIATTDDAAAPSGEARSAVGMIGAAGSVQAGPQNVVLTVNMAVIRTHPEGKRMGPLISQVPQWDTFVEGTGVDPLRDIDWISINGPALLHTEKDVILVHYSAPDAVVDKAIGVLAKRSGQGGPTNVGVPGVKATRGYADRAERVFLRPQPHVLAVVPAYYAKTAAQILSKATVPRALKRNAEAMRLTLVHPHGPMPGVPESVTEFRVWIVPRNGDGGADVYGEGDTASPDAAEGAAAVIDRLIQEQNSFGVQLLTRGLLNHVEIRADGPTIRMHLSASREQIQVILAFVAGQLGVSLPPEPSASAAPPPPPTLPR
jgi:hypothetical protein